MNEQAKESASDSVMRRVSLRRVVLPDDSQFLLALYASTREAELNQIPWDEQQREVFINMQFNLQARSFEARYPDAEHSIILFEEKSAGRMIVNRTDAVIHLIDISLLTEYRNAGIGGALIRELLGEGARAQIPVTLHVRRDNPARRLYERLGFMKTDEAGLYDKMERRA